MSTQPGGPMTPQQRSQIFVRVAVLNGLILAAAVLTVYVFDVFDDPSDGLWLIIAAAVLTGLIMAATVLRMTRRDSAVDAEVPTVAPRSTGFSLTVEDVFSITGRGTVATGTVRTGTLQVGQAVRIVRDGRHVLSAQVNGLEAFRRTVALAQPGENIGVLLSGVTREDLARGDLLQT